MWDTISHNIIESLRRVCALWTHRHHQIQPQSHFGSDCIHELNVFITKLLQNYYHPSLLLQYWWYESCAVYVCVCVVERVCMCLGRGCWCACIWAMNKKHIRTQVLCILNVQRASCTLCIVCTRIWNNRGVLFYIHITLLFISLPTK